LCPEPGLRGTCALPEVQIDYQAGYIVRATALVYQGVADNAEASIAHSHEFGEHDTDLSPPTVQLPDSHSGLDACIMGFGDNIHAASQIV
jgi:hypothetical protein